MKPKHQFTKLLTLLLTFTIYFTAYAQERRELGNMILEDVPEIPEEITSRIQQYQNTRSASFADWKPKQIRS